MEELLKINRVGFNRAVLDCCENGYIYLLVGVECVKFPAEEIISWSNEKISSVLGIKVEN